MKVTADTITDEQIREFGRELGSNFEDLIAIALDEVATRCMTHVYPVNTPNVI